ncbi:nuclear transport factor 2 family protein [Rhabdothermincola salaria]|uniref:nuclear transport factor 2 family protein n=1 Tax=Rhabdothermincola salaria TaxID=2903142 RepID=UPI001E296FCB|nr:nuclear transport factor 2 family protein [Rhabdothermincola salaria]MCD9625433.1 nuclear transport factor 2 family protein [Rhabdothermincola salaria]
MADLSSSPPSGDDPEALVRALWAHDQIRALASRYAVAIDARDIEGLVALFVDDVQVGRRRTGREALAESFRASLGAIGPSMLHVTSQVVDLVDADHATGSVYCLADVVEDHRMIRQAILYRDTYERRDGRWFFVRRIHELFYGVPRDENPLDQSPANWPERSWGRGTVPESWPSWGRFWAGSGD